MTLERGRIASDGVMGMGFLMILCIDSSMHSKRFEKKNFSLGSRTLERLVRFVNRLELDGQHLFFLFFFSSPPNLFSPGQKERNSRANFLRS